MCGVFHRMLGGDRQCTALTKVSVHVALETLYIMAVLTETSDIKWAVVEYGGDADCIIGEQDWRQ